jgi:hypothetical protein
MKARYLLFKILIWMIKHSRIAILLLGLVIFVIAASYVPLGTFDQAASFVLLLTFIFGSNFYVYQGLSKIKSARSDVNVWAVTVPKLSQSKKDIEIWITLAATVSGIGLAALYLTPSQIQPVPQSLLVFLGAVVEATVTVIFALIYWLLLFFMMERLPIDKAANWAGAMSFFFNLTGASATVMIAMYIGLKGWQDFSVAFIPYLLVFYLVSGSIPEYELKGYSSLDSEVCKINEKIDKVKQEIASEAYETRKTLLQTNLSGLEGRKKRLEATREWFTVGLDEIIAIRSEYLEFCGKVELTRQAYTSKVNRFARKEIGVLVNEKMHIVKLSRGRIRLTSAPKPIGKRTIMAIANALALRQVAVEAVRFRRISNTLNLEWTMRNRSQIAITQSSALEMPAACREFDRKTLERYEPAIIQFRTNLLKYNWVLYHARRYPSSSLTTEFDKIQNDLLTSTNELQKCITEIVNDYTVLEREHPDCYIVKQFRFFFGIFGLSALRDSLVELDAVKNKITKRKSRLESKTKALEFDTQA